MKKTKARMFFVAMVSIICLTALLSLTTYAAYETERNDTMDTADEISFGEKVSGVIDESSDSDYYKVTVNQRGYIEVKLTHNYVTDSSTKRWYVRVYKQGDETSQIYDTYYYAKNFSDISDKISVEKGTYYIRITNEYDGVAGIEYNINVSFTATEYYELEPNDSFSQANSITFEKTYTGCIISTGDYYKLTVNKRGYIEVKLTHNYVTDSSTKRWYVRVYKQGDETSQIYDTYYYAKNFSDISDKIGVEKGTYYIRITNEYDGVAGIEYNINVSFTATEYYELEHNDNFSQANNITLEKTYTGYIGSTEDYYKFDVDKSGCFEVKLTHNYVTDSSTKRWRIRVYKQGDETSQLYDAYFYAKYFSNTSEKIGVEKGTYYIRITNEYDGVDGIEYNIRVSEVKDNPFNDIDEGKWYTDSVLWCYHYGYMAGLSDATFGYRNSVTRAMFVTILAQIDEADTSSYSKMSFSDVPSGKWYSNAIEWAARKGYAAGVGNGQFGRNANVTRETLAQFFYTYSKMNGVNVTKQADLNVYSDRSRVHDWAYDAVEWAVAEGLISGTSSTTLSPRASATRAEIAIIIQNYVENIKK